MLGGSGERVAHALEAAQVAQADADAAEAALLNATSTTNVVQLYPKAMELEITREPEPESEPESKDA